MADKNSIGSASTSGFGAESSRLTIGINVKTLESQVYSFQVNRNISIPSLKEKVANETGVPAELQRLIFKGRVLKDDHMLCEYHVEDGDTLHLVTRPPGQPQTPTAPTSGEVNINIGNRGHGTRFRVRRGRGWTGATRRVITRSADNPSSQMPIPDALYTLMVSIEQLESVFSTAGCWPSPSPINGGDTEREDLPYNAHGLPTPEALSVVLRRAEQLLSRHAVAALSHIAGRLEVEGGANDPTMRNQIQTEAVQVGRAIEHLGPLLLELGRTIRTLHMGQSPAQSLVHPGPAVYISPTGPNPIMVLPFPVQTSSLFGGPASSQPIPGMNGGPIGSGGSYRNNTIGSRGIDGEGNNHQRPPNGFQSGQANPVNAFSLYGMAPQMIQRPTVRDTFNQFRQQVHGNLTDPERFGFELSRMTQQMRLIVAEALAESELGSSPVHESYDLNRELQRRQQVYMFNEIVARVRRGDPREVIFDNVLELVSSWISTGDLEDSASELSTRTELANGIIEMIQRDMRP